MVSGGMTCVKYLLFGFNLLFVITGIVIITVGGLAIHSYSSYSTFMDEKFSTGPLVLIIVGAIIFVVAFFGCCGAVRENHCMVVTFSVLLLTIFCIELAAGICGYVYRDDVKNGLEKHFEKSMEKYSQDDNVRHSWDIVQHDLHCCGVNSSLDWKRVNVSIPVTCCGEVEDSKCVPESIYKDGCVEAMKAKVESFALIICGVGIGIAFVQLVGVIFACCLAKSIRKEYETV